LINEDGFDGNVRATTHTGIDTTPSPVPGAPRRCGRRAAVAMSRHIVNIANPEAGETHAVIGYDRMLGQYFVQVCAIADVGEVVTREFHGDELTAAGVRLAMPEELVFLLLREAAGLSSANVCMDWRAGDPRRGKRKPAL